MEYSTDITGPTVDDITEYAYSTVTDLITKAWENVTVDEDNISDGNATNKVTRDSKQFNVYQFAVPVIAVIILLANILVIISTIRILRRSKTKERCTYICMANLALSDALTAFMVGGGAVFPNDKRTVTVCYVNLGLILTATMASLLFVVLMSLDRFVFIAFSFSYKDIVTPTRTKIIVFVAWILSFIMGFIPVTIWRTDHVETCMFIHIAAKECVVFVVVVGIFIPVTAVLISYTIVLRKAIAFLKAKKERQERNMAGMKYIQGKPEEDEEKKDKGVLGLTSHEWRVYGACIIVVLAFIFTWMPYFIASLMYFNCSSVDQCKAISTALATTLAMLGLLNSLLNPIIYTWWQKGLWKDIKAIFSCCNPSSCFGRRSLTINVQNQQKNQTSVSGSKTSTKTSTSSMPETNT